MHRGLEQGGPASRRRGRAESDTRKRPRTRPCSTSPPPRARAWTGSSSLLIDSRPALSTSQERLILGDLIREGDHVLCVVPIDLAAPKGRLILPQVQVLREILDCDAMGTVVKEREIEAALSGLRDAARPGGHGLPGGHERGRGRAR